MKKPFLLFLVVAGYVVGCQIIGVLSFSLCKYILGREDIILMWIMLGLVAVLLILGIPILQKATRRICHYPGTGDPVSENILRQKIQEINDFDSPIQALEKGKNLIVRWNYVDAKWWGILSRRGMKKTYELKIRFNDTTKTATLVDIIKMVSFGKGPTSARYSFFYACGLWVFNESEIAWGLTDNFKIGKVYEYSFSDSEIKVPVINTINVNGWAVEFSLW
ncbi:hypothetical protein [Desulfogranum japonicum]|uniref:hypothetical protein n=1 Tax=Desulfogranum japonicum TaxID=231447 RepID=UPI00048BFDBD|nr:hypothetical protein [Desulfogranum japonicum]